PPLLERGDELQVLELHDDVDAEHLRQGAGPGAGGALHGAGDALGGGAHVVEGDRGSGQVVAHRRRFPQARRRRSPPAPTAGAAPGPWRGCHDGRVPPLEPLPPVTVDAIELVTVSLPLATPLTSAAAIRRARPVLLVHVVAREAEGWAECVAEATHTSHPETVAHATA